MDIEAGEATKEATDVCVLMVTSLLPSSQNVPEFSSISAPILGVPGGLYVQRVTECFWISLLVDD